MNVPETRYARSGDIMVAYQVTGEGRPVDLVWAPGTVSHLDLDWEWRDDVRMFERLSRFCRLIRFDKRGTGLSDRPTAAATLEERMDDIRAVMDAAGSERAFLFGLSEGANMACLFAATYPQRTRGLIVWGGNARWVQSDDYPWGLSVPAYEAMIQDLSEHGITDSYLFGPGAGMPLEMSEVEREAVRRYCRAAASPAACAALERMNMLIDTRDVLRSISVPTLVMNRTGDPVANVDAARALAEAIPGARFVEFPGDSHYIPYPDAEPVLAEIEEFVTGVRSPSPVDRVLATVLFTDIVGSTEKQAALGDRGWKDLVERHHAAVRSALGRWRGVENDTAGDGFYATFDGPARAINCALEITERVRGLGLEVRAGVHTGECEVIENKCGGLTVSIGARVAAKAGPSEVLVSRTVKDLVAGSGLTFEDAGEHELKGVPERWRLYRVVSVPT